jgi:GT2 family glycosyltransferase
MEGEGDAMSDPGKISVILLIHNNIDMSRRCLDALADALTGLNHEVFILDNGSTEDTGSLRQYDHVFERFQWIRSNENKPFSIANNHCARESSGDCLLFLNNDVFLRPEIVQCLVAPLLEDGIVAATGGKLLFPGETSVQHAGIGQMLWDHPSNYGVGAIPTDRRIQQRCERFALSGAMLCVKREIFKNTGGFDERYVWGTEDIDLCLKIRAAGHKVMYCPDAVAVHHESATLRVQNNRNTEGNRRLYRRIWDSVLIPAEQRYVRFLKNRGIRRVAVFGTGTAARGIARILDENDIQIACFTGSDVRETGQFFLNRPVLPLDLLRERMYDRLMVASQYFFEIESKIRDYDPLHEPVYPLLN